MDELYGVTPRALNEKAWNLYDRPTNEIRGDALLVCNTLMCSKDPAQWLANMAEAADYLILQDLAIARRGGGGRNTAPETGDFARFSITSHDVIGQTDEDAIPVFDLSSCGARVIDVETYTNEGEFLKFAALIDLRPLQKKSFSIWSVLPPLVGLLELATTVA